MPWSLDPRRSAPEVGPGPVGGGAGRSTRIVMVANQFPKFSETFIIGDGTANSFMGINDLIPAGQTLSMGANGAALATGTLIGVTAAKTLAWATGKPLIMSDSAGVPDDVRARVADDDVPLALVARGRGLSRLGQPGLHDEVPDPALQLVDPVTFLCDLAQQHVDRRLGRERRQEDHAAPGR